MSSGLGHGYYPLHVGWFERNGVLALVPEHGPLGPAAVLYLCTLANEQDGFREGTVVSGCHAIAQILGSSAAKTHAAIESAAANGVLDDLEWFPDKQRFRCRISGWEADREGAQTANKRAEDRERAAEKRAAERAERLLAELRRVESQTVADSRVASQTVAHPHPDVSFTKGAIRGNVDEVFEAWKASTGHADARLGAKRKRVIENALKMYPLGDLLDAVDGWRFSAHHSGRE